jgi:FtsH-binding integral membrane protein
MADFDRYPAASSRAGGAVDYSIDEGLRAHMLQVYNYMGLGLAITGAMAFLVYTMAVTGDPASAALGAASLPMKISGGLYLTSFGKAIFLSPLKWVVMFAPLVMVFIFAARIESMSLSGAQTTFWVYAALMGLSLSSVFLVYTHGSITRVFFITAATFGSMSLWGYTTKRDLSGMGSFLVMGLIGIVIASIVNIFLASSALQFAVSVLGVVIFTGLTAYDTQTIKEMYSASDSQAVAGRKAIFGALQLYLDFINLFLMLLRLLGDRE